MYLSPILDAHGRYIASYSLSKSPNLGQIKEMMDRALSSNSSIESLILHSDQGWQYQHDYFVETLSKNGVTQSMSRKGNSIDNGLMESFFGILKSEMFYGHKMNIVV